MNKLLQWEHNWIDANVHLYSSKEKAEQVKANITANYKRREEERLLKEQA